MLTGSGPDRSESGVSVVHPLLRVRLFSTMEVQGQGGVSLLPKSRKARGVLAVLALNAGQPVMRDELTGLLWSRREREQARASLRQAIHELGDLLHRIDPGLFQVDRRYLSLGTVVGGGAGSELVWVDTLALSHARGAGPDLAELFRPVLVEDLLGVDPAFDNWRAVQIERLSRVARSRAEAWLTACQAMDAGAGSDDLRGAAEQLIAIDRAHEGAWRALIRAYLARGDRAAAVNAFERCADALATVAQLAPSEETVALLAGIREPGTGLSSSSRGPGQFGEVSKPTDMVEASGVARAASMRSTVRIGVMPLRALDASGSEELSLGLAAEITYALSRVSWLACVAPSSLAAVVEPDAVVSTDARAVWRSLDLDLLFEGTVQRGGGRVRVMMRLLDLRIGGEVIWSRRFDRDETDVLSLQDAITAETVAQLDPELLLREGDKARARLKIGANANSLSLSAIPAIYRLESDGFHDAGAMLEAAVASDPGNASAHGWYAYWHLLLVGQGWAKDPLAARLRGGELAERAVMLDPRNARALTLAGHVRGFLRHRADEALELHERALEINPHLALAWCFSALAFSYLGRHREALERVTLARKLAPFDSHGFFFDMAATMPHLMLHDYERAVELGHSAIALNPNFSSTYKGQLAALGHLGRRAEASDVLAQLLALEPGFCVRDAVARSPLIVQEDLAHYATGLRLGGLAENPA